MIENIKPVISNTKEARKRRNRAQRRLDKSNYVVIFLKREADFITWLESNATLPEGDQFGSFWEQHKTAIKNFDETVYEMKEAYSKMGYTRFYGSRSAEAFVSNGTRGTSNYEYSVNEYSHRLWGKDENSDFLLFIHHEGKGAYIPVLVLFDPNNRDLDLV